MRLRAVTAFAVLLLLATAFAPLATADHAYSHRFIYYGRVVDVDGTPVQGVTVSVQQTPAFDGGCGVDPKSSPTTDVNGTYFICGHKHALSAGSWKLSVAGKIVEGELNTDTRKHRVNVQLDQDIGNISGATAGNPNFSHGYSLWVTLWQPGDSNVEGISVEGVAKEGRDVEAVLTYNDGKTLTASGETNSYGDVLLTFEADEPITSGTVKVTEVKEDITKTAAIDTTFYASTVLIEYPQEVPSGVWGLVVIVGVIALGAIGYVAVRFKKQKETEGVTRAARRRKK